MNWIINNWSLLVVIVAFIYIAYIFSKNFLSMPTDEQINKVKEWLLYAVTLAEKEFGEKTGQLKLRYTYDLFVSKFPDVAKLISFEMFSRLVDEALEQMKHSISTNKAIADFVSKEE